MVLRNGYFLRSKNERGLICWSADLNQNVPSFVYYGRRYWGAGNAG